MVGLGQRFGGAIIVQQVKVVVAFAMQDSVDGELASHVFDLPSAELVSVGQCSAVPFAE